MLTGSTPFQLEVQDAAKPRRRLSIVLDERDPFRITGPASVSFSGGRTSAYLLWRILRAYGGELPPDVVVLFANTGKERPETLDFVRDCETHWRVPVVWLERERRSYREVSYETAARNGEPFQALIRSKLYLPNIVTRYCTQELKIRTMRRYLRRAKGWRQWHSIVGLRADETHRVAKGWARNASGKEVDTLVYPLHTAGVALAEVEAFWSQQPFRLGLNPWEGNCDLCMLKGRNQRLRVLYDRPETGDWWRDQEAWVTEHARPTRARRAAVFDKRAAVASMCATAEAMRSQQRLPDPDVADDAAFACACTD